MLRLLAVAATLSAWFGALRAGSALQAFFFETDDPLATSALLSELAAALFFFTAELGLVLLAQSRWLVDALPVRHPHGLADAGALAAILVLTVCLYRLFPSPARRRPRR